MEKRINNRVLLNIPVGYSLDGSIWLDGRAIDISATGIFITTNKELEIGQLIRISFRLDKVDKNHEIEIGARVVRVTKPKGKPISVALRFVAFGPDDDKIIYKYITKFR